MLNNWIKFNKLFNTEGMFCLKLNYIKILKKLIFNKYFIILSQIQMKSMKTNDSKWKNEALVRDNRSSTNEEHTKTYLFNDKGHC